MPHPQRRTSGRSHPPPASQREKEKRKQKVLTRRSSSVVRSIADAVVIKDQGLYFVTERDGSVPLSNTHGFGLYFHDCRFLNGYEIKLAGKGPSPLAATSSRGRIAILELTNPDFHLADGQLVEKEGIGITWKRTIDSDRQMLEDLILLRNYTPKEVAFPLTMAFQAHFEDIFGVRGLLPEHPGRLSPPAWKKDFLQFVYKGGDDLYRSVAIHFSLPPHKKEKDGATFRMKLRPEEPQEIVVTVAVIESPRKSELNPKETPILKSSAVAREIDHATDDWLSNQTEVQSDSLLLNSVLGRSLRGLGVLRTCLSDRHFFAAGVPWFVTLFGRDSLISCLQTLAFEWETAEQTLRLLARYQGQKGDEWRDEQPGKILHELRVGELARMNEIPFTPYYGTVDATPLFLILIGRHAAWTGDLSLFRELRSHIDRALAWIASEEAEHGEGHIAYESKSEKGLVNQGWKDSGDAIINADGGLAQPPIALVEVQGYVYLAKILMADLFRRAGEADRADRLAGEAKALRARFNRDFWLEGGDSTLSPFRPAGGLRRSSRRIRARRSGAASPIRRRRKKRWSS